MTRCSLYAPGTCPLCDDLSKGEPFHRVRRGAGSLLLRHGNAVTSVYRLVSGRIRLSVGDVAGDERACAVRGAGTLLGLEGIAGLPALRDVRVAQDSELAAASPQALRDHAGGNPELAVALLDHALLEHAKLCAEQALVDGTAEQRLARFLMARASNPLLALWREVPRHEIAGLLAIRPETLSRAVRHLQLRGAISADLEVLDAAALRRAAGEAESDPPT